MEYALIALVSGLVRAATRASTNPEMSPEQRFWDAALFGAGTALGTASTVAMVKRGEHPATAGALTAGVGALAVVATRDRVVTPLAQGAIFGAGVGAVGATIDPNWSLGLKPRVFVSHSFRDTSEYHELTGGLSSAGLSWYDHSVPVYDQFETTSSPRLRGLLWGQIRGTSVVALLAGPGVSRRPCVRDEIAMATTLSKPIIVVDQDPYGESPLPPELREYPLVERVLLGRNGSLLGAMRRLLAARNP
jgi:hypothetical protein